MRASFSHTISATSRPPLSHDELAFGLSVMLIAKSDWRINDVHRYVQCLIAGQAVTYAITRDRNVWRATREDVLAQAAGAAIDDRLPPTIFLEFDVTNDDSPQPHVHISYALEVDATELGSWRRVSGSYQYADPTDGDRRWALRLDRGVLDFELRLQPAVTRTSAVRHGAGPTARAHESIITAPMPGRLLRLLVQPGDQVADRQVLAVLEAMKMEHRIEAVGAGSVKNVSVQEGDIVAAGAPLLELEPQNI